MPSHSNTFATQSLAGSGQEENGPDAKSFVKLVLSKLRLAGCQALAPT